MATADIILNGLSADELVNLVVDRLTDTICQAIRNAKAEELKEKFLSISEVQKMFVPAISRKTVDNWTKEGLLKKHVIGGKPWYRYSEVLEAVKGIKKYSPTKNVLT